MACTCRERSKPNNVATLQESFVEKDPPSARKPIGAQLFFRLIAAAYEHRALGVGSHWPFEEWGRFLPEHNTAVSLLDRLVHHGIVVVTSDESFEMKEARTRRA